MNLSTLIAVCVAGATVIGVIIAFDESWEDRSEFYVKTIGDRMDRIESRQESYWGSADIQLQTLREAIIALYTDGKVGAPFCPAPKE